MNEYKNIEGIMAKAVKLADIAEQVGVSTVTVSKVFVRTKRVSANAGKWGEQEELDTVHGCGNSFYRNL